MPTPVTSQEIKNLTLDSKLYYLTKNDKNWADEHCLYILDKYVNIYDSDDKIDLDKYIWSIMKDLKVFFDVEDDNHILENAYKRLGDNTVRDFKFFEAEVYKYIADYRDLKLKEMQAEGVKTVSKAFEKKEKDIIKLFETKKKTKKNYLKIENAAEIIEDLKSCANIRLINLDHNKPKENTAIPTEDEEQEYINIMINLLKSNKVTEVSNIMFLKSVMLGYLKADRSKYSFVYVPQINDSEGLDPYADHGDVAPDEKVTAKTKMHKSQRIEEDELNEQIYDAEQSNQDDKVKLLKKIKKLMELKYHAAKVSEENSIDMMIESTYKQIEELENEAEGEYNEAEAEGEGDVNFYDGEGEVNASQRRNSQSHKPGETLEERREKGLREIFDNYARSQMLIGKKATFEMIQHELSNLNLGEYIKFSKDFSIPVSKVKVTEIFKKIATNSKELYFEDFKNTLWKLFEARDIEEGDKLKKRLRELKKIQKKKIEDVKQSEKPKKLEKVEERPNSDLKEVYHQVEDKLEKDSKASQPKTPPKVMESQVISRPKGGDPKNVETLKNIQMERRESQEEISQSALSKANPNDQKKDDSPRNEINKKVEFKDKDDDKSDKKSDRSHHKEHPASIKKDEIVDETEQERERILNRIEELRKPTQEEYQEQILSYIECDNPRAYKIRAKGEGFCFLN